MSGFYVLVIRMCHAMDQIDNDRHWGRQYGSTSDIKWNLISVSISTHSELAPRLNTTQASKFKSPVWNTSASTH